MPCRCDDNWPWGWGDANRSSNEEKNDSEHVLRCRAQSLLLKMTTLLQKNQVNIPEEIQTELLFHQKSFLKHKRDELQKDISALKVELNKLKQNMKSIESMGGLVSPQQQEELASILEKMEQINSITDEEILENK